MHIRHGMTSGPREPTHHHYHSWASYSTAFKSSLTHCFTYPLHHSRALPHGDVVVVCLVTIGDACAAAQQPLREQHVRGPVQSPVVVPGIAAQSCEAGALC